MYSEPLATFVTTTTFGTWLPGDDRGYADNGEFHPPRPQLAAHVRQGIGERKVVFSNDEQEVLLAAIVDAASEFEYSLTDVVIEATHMHWIVRHSDEVAIMVGRLKNRMRQRLARGRIWTAGYSCRLLFRDLAVDQARQYLWKHDGLRMLAGRIVMQ